MFVAGLGPKNGGNSLKAHCEGECVRNVFGGGGRHFVAIVRHLSTSLAVDPASLTGCPRTAPASLPGGAPDEPVSAQLIFADAIAGKAGTSQSAS